MTRNKLFSIKKKQSGRDASGHVSTRHRGGEHKRFLRLIDWQRAKKDIQARVVSIEYDPNRTAKIALLAYTDGTKKYILATSLLKLGDTVVYSDTAPIKDGNKLSLKNIPVGTPFHCLEYRPGSQAQLIKSAGSAAYLQSVEEDKAIVKLPSGEIRIFSSLCTAVIGQVSNIDHSNQKMTKAGDSRHRGIRPSVRGVAQDPRSHPHGGGEGRSSIGMNPKTPWGKVAMGKITRKRKKHSNRLIIKHRK
ncbi:50S ribosomal protein L2 [Candidatus Shapirobacteria bacterium CG06_land_8_20_14_3_00_40_12]|uniref:Large ribosomal subunit protein uL2 n=2 Tax=Candidatus Shapironibacteriota TaxID=1752721 RepID=A0A2M7TT29_9BACT|nr:MAG: 50S ribosomal protein L2 [Candidatus Shapirobacteria bacterium CG06_land_8_20_14_3_00_40_12]PIZ58939.1 MAG: 50S ribosomal protein L2 [Candidatus Shapirobacteria bacterium CG_4_10_14_0_2_um_filter_40_12]